MPEDHLEHLLRGYRLPEVSPELDRRVLFEGGAILERAERARTRQAIGTVGRSVLDRLGFGWLGWFIDLLTLTDAEYRVELI